MFERLPAWIKNKWSLFGLSLAAALLLGVLIFFLFLRGPFATLLTNQGQKALKEQDFRKAADKFETALSLKKNREAIYLGYGDALIGLKDYNGAIEILEDGIDRMSGAEELYLGKARALVAAGKIGEGVDFLDNIGDSYINKKIQALRPADLTFSPAHGKYSKAQTVTINQRPGEKIYYTLNGEDPTMASAIYKEPLTLRTSATLTAIAVSENGLVSPRLRLDYEIDNTNRPIEFTDKKIERMVRAALDRPSGNLYAAQLASVSGIFNDGIEGEIRTLEDLEYLPNLTHLRLNDELLIDDYTPLTTLTELEILSMAGCALSDGDLSYISGLTKLTELILDDNEISTLEPLSGLESLEFLAAADNELSTTVDIAAFTKLKWLYLANNKLYDLDGLAELNELVALDVSHNAVTDLAPLAGLNKLTDLFLRGNRPNNIKKLSNLPALTHLDLSACGLASLSVVNDFKALVSLTAEENEIASLSTFTRQVSELYISHNPLVDLSPLKSQAGLQVLEASDTQIADISFLAGNQTLTALDISGTKVTDATALINCPQLTYLVCPQQCSTAGLPATVDVNIQ